jgi:hypothetical protein
MWFNNFCSQLEERSTKVIRARNRLKIDRILDNFEKEEDYKVSKPSNRNNIHFTDSQPEKPAEEVNTLKFINV